MSYLTDKPISWDWIAYRERVCAQHGGGALVTFVGLVRGDQEGSRAIAALHYEAYAEMAEEEIGRLVAAAKAQWLLDAVQVQHRVGYVAVGQIGVVVVVVAHHRAEAYAASQFLLERIKHEAPIWKRELYDDGTSRWGVCAPELLQAADPLGALHAHV